MSMQTTAKAPSAPLPGELTGALDLDDAEKQAPTTLVPIRIEQYLGALLMFTLFVITFLNVITRYVVNISFAFTEEISIVLMIMLTFMGAAVAVAYDRNLRVTYLVDKVSPKHRRWVNSLALIAVIVTFGIIARYGAVVTYEEWLFDTRSNALDVPQWIYSIWIPVLSVVLMLRAVGGLIRIWKAEY